MRVRSLLFLALAGAGVVSTAWATSFMPRPLDEALQDTPVIVRGTIGTQYTDWVSGPGNSRAIQTFFQLNIDEVLKGSVTGTSLVFREMGGEKDGVTVTVPGTADFQPGEDVVVLLSNPNPDGSYDLMGLSTGKYEVERNSQGREVLVGDGTQVGPHAGPRAGSGHDPQHPGSGEEGERPGIADQSKWTLETLRGFLRQGGAAAKVPSAALPPPVEVSVTKIPLSPPAEAPEIQPPARDGQTVPWSIFGRIFGAILLVGLGIFVSFRILRRKPGPLR